MKFADKATLNILSRTLGSVFLMVSSIIMTRYLTKETYGTYLQAMLIMNTVTMLAFVGLPQSIYYYFQSSENKAVFIYKNIALSLVIGIAVAAILMIFRTGICRLVGNDEIYNYMHYLALIIILQSPLSFRDPIFFSSGAYVSNSVSTIFCSAVDYLPLYYAVISGWNLKSILLVSVASKIFNLLFFIVLLKKYCLNTVGNFTPTGHEKKVGLLDQVRYAVPIGAAGYVGVIGSQVDKYIISGGFSPAQFAVYSRGAMEVPFISTITYMLNDITLPQYVTAYKSRDIGRLLDLMHANIDKVAKINIGIFAFLFVEAPLLMEILYTRQYADATPIFRITLMSLLFGVTVYNMIPTVTGNTRMLFNATLFSIVTKIVVCLALLKLMGPIGVALGVFVGSLLYMVYLLYCSVRILDVRWTQIMPWAKVGKICLIAFSAGIMVKLYHTVLLQLGLSDNLVSLGIAFVIFSYLYLCGLNLVGMVCIEDRDFIKRWLRMDPFLIMPRALAVFSKVNGS